jgi:VWFA-related protein
MKPRSVALAMLLFGVTIGAVTPMRGSAQQPAQQPQAPTFRTNSTLVELTVVATDNKGNPVTDLKQEELSIADDGKPRPIAFFRFEGAPESADTPLARREPLSPGIFTNRSEYTPGPPRNITAIVIDSLNTRPQDQAAVRAQVMRYLIALAPQTRVAVYRTGDSVKVLRDFTDDLQSLRSRLSKIAIEEYSRPTAEIDVEKVKDAIVAAKLDDVTPNDNGEMADVGKAEMDRLEEYYNQHINDERSDLTLQALEMVGNHLAGIPGRKSLVWISSGMPLLTTGTRDPWPRSYETAVRGLARRLASEGITIYPVEATGLTPVEMGTSSVARGSGFGQGSQDAHLGPLAKAIDLRLRAAMDVLAETTGGRFVKNTNDLAEGVKEASADMRGTYSVSLYALDAPDNQWHTFKMKSTRPGVKLLYRQGYLSRAPEKQQNEWAAEEWDRAVRNPVGSTAIRLDARTEVSGSTLYAVIQIASGDLYFHPDGNQLATEIDLALAERGTIGWSRVRTDRATVTLQNPQGDRSSSLIRLSKSWTLNPGTSAARLVVRDRLTGRYGVLDMPLEKLRSQK